MKVCIDSDRTGAKMKKLLASFTRALGYEVEEGKGRGEYPEIASALADRMTGRKDNRGILICGTGMGMAMAANKVRGVFAGVCRTADDANELAASKGGQIMALGSNHISEVEAMDITEAYLKTPIGDRPNARRMRELEAQQ